MNILSEPFALFKYFKVSWVLCYLIVKVNQSTNFRNTVCWDGNGYTLAKAENII